MNNLELQMVEILKDLKANHFVIGVKAEFEAEGTRMDEALRLKEIVMKADLDLTIKIGGCEAIKDLYDARSIGVKRIVAPMIETPYALKKYFQSIDKVFPLEEQKEMEFFCNIETETGYRNFQDMLAIPEIKKLKGIIIGRVDMVGSLGLKRDDVCSDYILDITRDLLFDAHQANLLGVVGGGVSIDSMPFFNKLSNVGLNNYETRKIIFKCPEALGETAKDGLLKAVQFELLWLKNKRDFYGKIFEEDKNRIDMLEKRWIK